MRKAAEQSEQGGCFAVVENPVSCKCGAHPLDPGNPACVRASYTPACGSMVSLRARMADIGKAPGVNSNESRESLQAPIGKAQSWSRTGFEGRRETPKS